MFNCNGKLCRKGQWNFVKHLVYVKAKGVSSANTETAAVYRIKCKGTFKDLKEPQKW